MATNYKTIRISEEVYNKFEDMEKEFRKHHPEFDDIPISKSKLVFEAFRIYLSYKKIF